MHGQAADQVGAICFRVNPDGILEVLLITTRETHRWTIPKGWPIKGLRPHEVAEREAWEEGGIKGKGKKKPYGYYTYLKRLEDNRSIQCVVEVHLLKVKKVRFTFPECRERVLIWLPPTEASSLVPEWELKSLISELHAKFSSGETGK
ncbi:MULTISPECIES: NUDIX hydrolase [Rhizobium]|uniref:MutT/NUDIX family NTP pyrophosphohydrolase n=1 Tax=Rhizobium favelukesii TaxID=348824 RepID=W6S211_9HYPH|nr:MULTISPECIES: NUDIX hydrolase [Rhizobium]MCS0463093.1 NUDIX hydrolase [Rhizobium favelukesii]UFS84874.1 NUDIX hydrolase [Rhizobium sp. T136]CDM60461.1 MutT/NUDIX family NTP pyrophosphohydrolase [Rhizobium favelukesii]